MVFKSTSESSSVGAMGMSEFDIIYEKVSKSRIMSAWIAKCKEREKNTSEASEPGYEHIENNHPYYDKLSRYLSSDFNEDIGRNLEYCVSEEGGEKCIQIEVLLLDVDDYSKWKIVLPFVNDLAIGNITPLTSSGVINDFNSLNGDAFSRASVSIRLDLDYMLSLMDVSNLKSDTFTHCRFAVRIFGKTFCFMEDSIVYEIEKDDTFSQPLVKQPGIKKFKIFLKKKETPKLLFDNFVKTLKRFTSGLYFDLIQSNSISFSRAVFSIFNSGKLEKEVPSIAEQIEKFWKKYYFFRSLHMDVEADVKLMQELKKKKKKEHIDIDELRGWEVPLFEYTIPKDIYKILKSDKNGIWKSDSVIILSYKQLHFMLSAIQRANPKFKEIYSFDYQFLKNLDRKCWYDHYWQQTCDPIIKMSHCMLNFEKRPTDENDPANGPNSPGVTQVEFTEATFLKDTNAFLLNHFSKVSTSMTDFAIVRASEVENPTIKILSLDGGGIKGLNLISMCERIEERLGKRMCDIFDLICGTSTGGILANLFRLGFTCKECKEVYHKLGKQIFKLEGSSNANIQKTLLTVKGKAWYDEKQLERFFKEYVGKKEDLNTFPNKKPLCFVLSTLNPLDEESKKYISRLHQTLNVQGEEQEFFNDLMLHAEPTPFIFRSYSDPFRYADNKKRHPDFYMGTLNGGGIKLWQALRCTSAAPLYFKEMHMGQRIFVDGAVVNNNPSVVALFEAKQIWPEGKKFAFVSLGTGLKKSQENAENVGVENVEGDDLYFSSDQNDKMQRTKSGGILENVKKTLASLSDLLALQLSSEKQHKLMMTQVETLRESKDQVHYFRFNTPTLVDYDLDIVEDKVLQEWEDQTNKYIDSQKDSMEELYKVLGSDDHCNKIDQIE